jgi:hypothetical protein
VVLAPATRSHSSHKLEDFKIACFGTSAPTHPATSSLRRTSGRQDWGSFLRCHFHSKNQGICDVSAAMGPDALFSLVRRVLRVPHSVASDDAIAGIYHSLLAEAELRHAARNMVLKPSRVRPPRSQARVGVSQHTARVTVRDLIRFVSEPGSSSRIHLSRANAQEESLVSHPPERQRVRENSTKIDASETPAGTFNIHGPDSDAGSKHRFQTCATPSTPTSPSPTCTMIFHHIALANKHPPNDPLLRRPSNHRRRCHRLLPE